MLGQFVRLWRYDRSCTSAVAFTKNENYYRIAKKRKKSVSFGGMRVAGFCGRP
jgi:hypothetical protein